MSWSKILLFIQTVLTVGTLIWAAAFLRANVDQNKEWNERQDQKIEQHRDWVRGTYVRQDVAQQRYKNLTDKLEAIDKKLD